MLVRQALILIEQNYVHLPLKRAMHSIDPVQRLKLLLQELEQTTGPQALPPEVTFHREMTEIFTSLRDLHTNYLLAFLPFMVEDYIEGGWRKYLVSHITPGCSRPAFVRGVELVTWNGIPIERSVWNNAQRFAGSNREAQHARGVPTLTTRALRITLPPDEAWVIVGYLCSSLTLGLYQPSPNQEVPTTLSNQSLQNHDGPVGSLILYAKFLPDICGQRLGFR